MTRGDAASADVTHRGGCHCGAVAFEVDAPADLTALECNCSICRMTGFVHLIVPRSRFRLVRGERELTDYRFNTGTARHLFCRRCGVKSFYVPRSNPDGYSVNVRCLDRASIASLTVQPFDDNDREASDAKVRDLSRDSIGRKPDMGQPI
ncbi:MAG TPA: GFA family protein [Steroidobacteraceae bacterium]|nr:GFA family protein [Steroidobacteraceae bacterium]